MKGEDWRILMRKGHNLALVVRKRLLVVKRIAVVLTLLNYFGWQMIAEMGPEHLK